MSQRTEKAFEHLDPHPAIPHAQPIPRPVTSKLNFFSHMCSAKPKRAAVPARPLVAWNSVPRAACSNRRPVAKGARVPGEVVDAYDLVGDALEHEGPQQRELVCVPVRRVHPRLLAPRRGLRELQLCLLEPPPPPPNTNPPALLRSSCQCCPSFSPLGQMVQHALQRLGAGVVEEVLERLHDDAVNARILVCEEVLR
ncbi:hypothetical protein DL765_006757 [Monosporascus sp. GIB2]|nr:hypothetical protein DL765_006757 [Monosporascus sp. GIB2]